MFHSKERGFTLIELLIVIGIIALLALIIILALNPADLFRQSRDANRFTESSSIQTALNLLRLDSGSSNMGSSSVIYVSLPDATATTTAGTDCTALGLSAPPGWSNHCAASSNYRNVDGTGWIPLNLTSMSIKSPFATLPIDPINSASSGNYYIYVASATKWAFAFPIESQKQRAKGVNDGGYDPARVEIGEDLLLIARAEGLAGWWTLDEGSGTTAPDYAKNNDPGTWQGTPSGDNGTNYTTGKIGPYAGSFNGTDDLVYAAGGPAALTQAFNSITLAGWVYITSAQLGTDTLLGQTGYNYSIDYYKSGGALNDRLLFTILDGSNKAVLTSAAAQFFDGWHQLVEVFNGSTIAGYIDGNLVASATSSSGNTGGTFTGSFAMGQSLTGTIDDVRFYTHAFLPAEVKALYNAQR